MHSCGNTCPYVETQHALNVSIQAFTGRSFTRCATNLVPRLSRPPPRPQRLKRLRRRRARLAHTRHTPSPPWSEHWCVLSKLLKSQAAAGAEPLIHHFP